MRRVENMFACVATELDNTMMLHILLLNGATFKIYVISNYSNAWVSFKSNLWTSNFYMKY